VPLVTPGMLNVMSDDGGRLPVLDLTSANVTEETLADLRAPTPSAFGHECESARLRVPFIHGLGCQELGSMRFRKDA